MVGFGVPILNKDTAWMKRHLPSDYVMSRGEMDNLIYLTLKHGCNWPMRQADKTVVLLMFAQQEKAKVGSDGIANLIIGTTLPDNLGTSPTVGRAPTRGAGRVAQAMPCRSRVDRNLSRQLDANTDTSDEPLSVAAGGATQMVENSRRRETEPCWIRTNDPVLKRHMLCHLS